MNENEIGKIIIETAIEIHRELGPGLFEHIYETVLAHELEHKGLTVERQQPIKIQYKDILFEEGFRADVIVNGKVIIELKSIESIKDVHKKQLLSYLKLTGLKLGYLLNFNEALMKNGIVRIINGII